LKHVSAPPRSYGQRLELAEGTSPQKVTYHCLNTTGSIYYIPLCICRVPFFLLRQRRGAAGLGELQ
jgi:hypothetical protein